MDPHNEYPDETQEMIDLSDEEIVDEITTVPETAPEPVPDEIDLSDEDVDEAIDLSLPSKIQLNVGGKKIIIDPKIVQQLRIDISKLLITKKKGQVIYFLDMDTDIFYEMVYQIKYQTNPSELNPQTLGELCVREILPARTHSYHPHIVLSDRPYILSEADYLVKVSNRFDNYVVCRSTLAHTTWGLMADQSTQIDTDMSSNILRLILRLLRHKHIAIITSADYPEFKRWCEKLKIYYVCHNLSVENLSISTEIPCKINQENNPYVVPIVWSAQNNISFGGDIMFALNEQANISQILSLNLIIDLPTDYNILPNTYVDNFEEELVNTIALYLPKPTNKIVCSTNQKFIQNMSNISVTNHKLVYENDLIDVKRISIPLELCANIPIDILTNHNQKKLLVLLAVNPLSKIVSQDSTIPLLNVCLRGNVLFNRQTHLPHFVPPLRCNSFELHKPHHNNPYFNTYIAKLPHCAIIDSVHIVTKNLDQIISDGLVCADLTDSENNVLFRIHLSDMIKTPKGHSYSFSHNKIGGLITNNYELHICTKSGHTAYVCVYDEMNLKYFMD